MKYIKVETYDDMSRIAGEMTAEIITNKPSCVLGLATGSSPIGLYEYLTEKNKKGEIDFSLVKTVNLDEYLGLAPDNDQSYRYFMNRHLFNKINIDINNTFVPDGMAENPEEECLRYDKIIESLGGIDLQILGVGSNGHIGFNEPGDEFTGGTHVVELKKETIRANSRFFEDIAHVPTKAITMGVGSIMSADKIILLAYGDKKRAILEKAMHGEVTPHVPASILQNHKDLTVIFSENS